MASTNYTGEEFVSGSFLASTSGSAAGGVGESFFTVFSRYYKLSAYDSGGPERAWYSTNPYGQPPWAATGSWTNVRIVGVGNVSYS